MAPRVTAPVVMWMVGWMVGCASTAPPPPPHDPVPLPHFTIELSVERRQIGLSEPRGCEGTVSGEFTIERPDGKVERVDVQPVELTERACVYGLGGGGECIARPKSWVALGGFELTAVGVYRIDGDALVLSCAPGRVTFRGARVAVLVAGADPMPLGENEPVPQIVVAPPPPQPPVETALDVRKRMQTTHHHHQGTVEGLLLPQIPGGTKPRAMTTRWGSLRFPPHAPAAFSSDHFGPAWLHGRTNPAAHPAPITLDGKAHIVVLVLEDGATQQGTKEAIRAGQSGGLIAATWRQLDGPGGSLALDVEATLDDAAARWRAHIEPLDAQIRDALTARLDEALGGTRGRYSKPISATETSYLATWSAANQHLIVRYLEQRHRSVQTKRGQPQRVCPPNRPASHCRNVVVRTGWSARANIAIELEYDRAGKLVVERAYPAMFEVHEAP